MLEVLSQFRSHLSNNIEYVLVSVFIHLSVVIDLRDLIIINCLLFLIQVYFICKKRFFDYASIFLLYSSHSAHAHVELSSYKLDTCLSWSSKKDYICFLLCFYINVYFFSWLKFTISSIRSLFATSMIFSEFSFSFTIFCQPRRSWRSSWISSYFDGQPFKAEVSLVD